MTDSDWQIVLNEANEAKAQLYLSALLQNGINAIMTNSAMATMLPIQDSAYILRVPSSEMENARTLISSMQQDLERRSEDSFYDANKDDIAYEKSINKYEDDLAKAKPIQLWFVLLILLVFIFLAYLSMNK